MNTQTLYLCCGLGGVIIVSLGLSLWFGRKLPTARDFIERDLEAYRLREVALEVDLVNRKHELNATREHMRRLKAKLAIVDEQKEHEDVASESNVLHIIKTIAAPR